MRNIADTDDLSIRGVPAFGPAKQDLCEKNLVKVPSLSVLCFDFDVLGGGGNVGMNPMGWLKISASMPEGRLSDISDSLSFKSNESSRCFFPPMIRLKNETPFL